MGATGMIEIRKLVAEDYEILQGIHEGFCPDPTTSIALVAVKDGELVGRIFLLAPTHIEGPWIREDCRKKFLGHKLIIGIEKEAKACGITKLFAYGNEETEDYLGRLGFEKLPMTVWSKKI